MAECLGISNQNCGLAAVHRAAKERSILIDYDDSTNSQRLIIGRQKVPLLEVVDLKNVQGTGIHDTAEFGCIACGRFVIFEDDDADYLVNGELISTVADELDL